jgi:hypothetical protein
MAQHVDQGMIGHRVAIGETPSFEIGDPLLLQSLPKFVQESGFSTACFGDNPYHVPVPCLDLGK